MSLTEADLYRNYLEDIDEEYHDVFLELVGAGSSPKVVQASLEYVTTPRTQEECSDEFGCSEVAIRHMYPTLIAMTDESMTDSVGGGGSDTSGTTRKVDFCKAIADHLGWEEGQEYSLRQAYQRQTPQPTLQKAGWESIFEELVES